MNAAAIRPRDLDLRDPAAAAAGVRGVLLEPAAACRRPRRGGPASMTCRRPARGAIAHSVDTDFTGVNVRSYPATAVVACREMRAR